MGKVYSGVEGISKPKLGSDWKSYGERAEEYVKKIKDYAKKHGRGPEAGKEISFGVADGKARYVVVSLKPVELIHLDIWDGYQYRYINRLTAADIRREIKAVEALDALVRRAKSRQKVGATV